MLLNYSQMSELYKSGVSWDPSEVVQDNFSALDGLPQSGKGSGDDVLIHIRLHVTHPQTCFHEMVLSLKSRNTSLTKEDII